MNRPNRRPSSGFTLLEVIVSSALFSLVILGGIGVTSTTLRSSSSSLDSQNAELVGRRIHNLLRAELLRAGVSTLQVENPVGLDPIPMEEGVDYDNLYFREATGWSDGVVQYTPEAGQPPRFLSFVPADETGRGELWLETGAERRLLSRQLKDAWFTLENRRLLVHLVLLDSLHDGRGSAELERSILLRAP